jgi:hypothetical protein
MHAVFLGLAMASGWSDLQVGGELRLDASAERLDLAGTSEGPQYGVGISRGALMLGAEPTFSTEVLLVMDVRSTGTELLLANDGSLVEVPPGFEAHLLDARLHKVAPRWAGAIGRMPALTGLDDYNQSLWSQRTPYFYAPGAAPSMTVMRREGLVPERVMATRLTFGDTQRLDIQGSLDGSTPLIEARAQTLLLGSVFVAGSGRYQLGDWTWHGAAMYTGWRSSLMVQVFGVNTDIGYAVRATTNLLSLNLTLEGTLWEAEYGALAALEWRHTEQLSSGVYWDARIPEDQGQAVAHNAGVQLKTWF